MIFKTFDNDLTGLINKVGLFNKSLYNIGRDFRNGNGLLTSLFSGQSVTSKDIQSINAMNQAMKNGSTMAQAWCDNMKGCTVAAKQQVNQCLKAKGSLTELANSLETTTISAKAASMALRSLSIAGNIIAFTAIAKGIQLATTAIDNWIHRVEKANEAMQEAVGEYESAKSSLENINSELTEQNKKINELLSKDKLTYAEKGQLEELQGITRELLLQQDIEQKRAEKASKDAASKAVDAYNKQYGKYNISREELNEKSENARISGIFPIVDSTNDITGNIVAYIRATEMLTEAQQNYEESLKSGIDTKYLDDDIQNTIDAVNEYSEILNENISDLQQKQLALEDEYNRLLKSVN